MQGIPPRALNGGLYTGTPFARSAWANVPIVPEAGSMVSTALRLGHAPPPGATRQYVSSSRPGNSEPSTDGLVFDEWTGFAFVPCPSR